jgi:hypothetical protein
MNPVAQPGAALISSTEVTTLLTQITTGISENMPAVLTLVGGILVISVGFALLNGGLKGKLKFRR